MKKIIIIATLFVFNIGFSQITDVWKYKENGKEYILKIERKNNNYSGNLIKIIEEGGESSILNKIFMVDFVKISDNTYKGKFKFKENRTNKGRIIQVDKNTLEFQYKWIFFYIKDTWKRVLHL